MTDAAIRLAAFKWLEQQVDVHGAVLSRTILARGFPFGDRFIPLVAPNGIFTPREMGLPLSITTAPEGPYSDAFGPTLLKYKYRGQDPSHHDNVGLRRLIAKREPLIYFHGLVPGRYLAVWPVFVVDDDPGSKTFSVAVDDSNVITAAMIDVPTAEDSGAEIRRGYITATVRRRIHQAAFRERVIDAYRQQCALCRLKHEELLDAAHIVPDSDPEGEPLVKNGVSLCKLHHAAFDRFFLSIRPDFVIEVRKDVLAESDGPMLKHGLQGMHGEKIILPRSVGLRPDPELLAVRHQRFLQLAE